MLRSRNQFPWHIFIRYSNALRGEVNVSLGENKQPCIVPPRVRGLSDRNPEHPSSQAGL